MYENIRIDRQTDRQTDIQMHHRREPRHRYITSDNRPDITDFDFGTDLDVSLAHSWISEVIFSSASTEGAAALRREQTKAEKYSMERLPGEEAVRLVPLVLEHFGHWGQQAEKFLHPLSLRSTDECGSSNSSQFKTYWRERLSVQIQRCNSRVRYRKVEGLLDRGDE